jgi:hypothetical protein
VLLAGGGTRKGFIAFFEPSPWATEVAVIYTLTFDPLWWQSILVVLAQTAMSYHLILVSL